MAKKRDSSRGADHKHPAPDSEAALPQGGVATICTGSASASTLDPALILANPIPNASRSKNDAINFSWVRTSPAEPPTVLENLLGPRRSMPVDDK